MSATATIAALWIVFTATHLGLASVRVEPGLRKRLGDSGFLGLYSVVALASFVPLCSVYFGNRHADGWLWQVSVGPGTRVALYLGMTVPFAMILGTLLDELEARDLKRGLATLCIGGGMGIATIIERV